LTIWSAPATAIGPDFAIVMLLSGFIDGNEKGAAALLPVVTGGADGGCILGDACAYAVLMCAKLVQKITERSIPKASNSLGVTFSNFNLTNPNVDSNIDYKNTVYN
jgi:hypothetical protein